MKKLDLVKLLAYIDCSRLEYQEWVNVGMALKHEGYGCDVWDAWSRSDPERYKPGECARKWQSFQGGMRNVTGAVITNLAKANGWLPRSKMKDEALEWDATINDEAVIVDKSYIEEEEIREPKKWDPADEVIRYLKALFRPDEKVGFVMQSFQREDGRMAPANSGSYTNTAQSLIDGMKKYRDITQVFGSYNEEAGAWIRFNPLDGGGVKDRNVTDYRFALIESDNLEPGKQLDIIKKLELPVAVLVHSGNKSIHAIVHIDADTFDEYRRRVEYLYAVCEKNSLQVDTNDRNPSRLSRLPGCVRKGRKQFIIAENIGKKDFAEWKEWVESLNDDLPDPENLETYWDNMPDLSPELIHGILRQGHKMLLAGPSKAGKSFALIELSIAIAEGTTWFGWQCAQGKVLYVNLELDKASCLNRFRDVYEGLGIPPEHINNVDIWNLRGKALPMDKLAPKLIRRANGKDYIAVIIDPIYKVLTGDENSADQMAHFCNQFDKVATQLKSAVIYCHHHSKGLQGAKRSMDRASGSGVFARDPDAMLDMIQVTPKKKKADEKQDEEDTSRTAWRVTGILREFPPFRPVNMWFDWPIHIMDETDELKNAAAEGDAKDLNRKSAEKRQTKAEARRNDIDFAIADKLLKGQEVILKDLAAEFGMTEKTIRADIKKMEGHYRIEDGKIFSAEEGT